MLYSISWPNFIVWLSLVPGILGSMRVAVVCFPFFSSWPECRGGLGCLGGGLRYLGGIGRFWPFLVFWTVGAFVGCVRGRGLGARAPRLPGYILLVDFSDTLLVVSILDIQSRELGGRTWPYEVYPAGKLQ